MWDCLWDSLCGTHVGLKTRFWGAQHCKGNSRRLLAAPCHAVRGAEHCGGHASADQGGAGGPNHLAQHPGPCGIPLPHCGTAVQLRVAGNSGDERDLAFLLGTRDVACDENDIPRFRAGDVRLGVMYVWLSSLQGFAVFLVLAEFKGKEFNGRGSVSGRNAPVDPLLHKLHNHCWAHSPHLTERSWAHHPHPSGGN